MVERLILDAVVRERFDGGHIYYIKVKPDGKLGYWDKKDGLKVAKKARIIPNQNIH
jgi:hypothetical protein